MSLSMTSGAVRKNSSNATSSLGNTDYQFYSHTDIIMLTQNIDNYSEKQWLTMVLHDMSYRIGVLENKVKALETTVKSHPVTVVGNRGVVTHVITPYVPIPHTPDASPSVNNKP